MSWSNSFTRLFRKREIASAQDLEQFLESRAAFLVQKSITEYSQARANMLFSTLLGEQGFRTALENAKWQGFPAALAMVAEVLAGVLRQRLAADEASARLTQAAEAIIARYPVPAGKNSDYWRSAVQHLNSDLARASLSAPKPAHTIPHSRAQEIFDSLPFHQAIRAHDFEMFRNTLSFHLTAIAAELETRTVSWPQAGKTD